jgi:hypothetical protein
MDNPIQTGKPPPYRPDFKAIFHVTDDLIHPQIEVLLPQLFSLLYQLLIGKVLE